jgi:aminotransferase
MDQSRFIAKHVVNLPKSGIRDFFDIVAKMKDAISLGVGEPEREKTCFNTIGEIFLLLESKKTRAVDVSRPVYGPSRMR